MMCDFCCCVYDFLYLQCNLMIGVVLNFCVYQILFSYSVKCYRYFILKVDVYLYVYGLDYELEIFIDCFLC